MGFTVTPITIPSFDLTVTTPLQVTIRGSYALQKVNTPMILPGVRPPTSPSEPTTGWNLSARYWIYAHQDYNNIHPIYQSSVSVNCANVPADPFAALYAALKELYPGTHVDN